MEIKGKKTAATESDIEDPDEWNTIKRPVIPTVAFGDDGLDREMIEVIEVHADGDLRILDGSGDRVAIDQLTDQVDQDNRDGRDDQASANADADELDMLEDL